MIRPRFLVIAILFLAVAGTATGIDHVSREEAVQAIENATQDIEEMQDAGLPTTQPNDTLQQARSALLRADYARILEENATGPTARKARAVLAGLNRSQFTYANVLTHTRQIQERRERAFRLHDEITAAHLAIRDARRDGVDVSAALRHLSRANTSFHRERFDTVDAQVEETNTALNAARAEQSVINVVQTGAASLIQRYGSMLLAGLVVLTIAAASGWRWWRRRKLRQRLSRLHTEQEALEEMMRESQKTYFSGGDLSERVFRTRMDAYRERLNTVEEEIAVVEDQLDTGGWVARFSP